MRLSKPWLASDDALALLHGNLGVFQLGDAAGDVLYIGVASGLSKFGLKGAVSEALAKHSGAVFVRYEVTTSYHTRYRELLMLHKADFGELPVGNSDASGVTLGQLSPG